MGRKNFWAKKFVRDQKFFGDHKFFGDQKLGLIVQRECRGEMYATQGTWTLDMDKFRRAILTHRNAPDRETGVSPALIVFGHPIRDFCQTSDLGLRLEVYFVFPLSQQQQQEPLTKIYRIE